MNGNAPQRRPSAISHSRSLLLLIEILLILAGGFLASFLHYKLRIPLNLPGHHGLEFMAIYMTIRLQSKLRYAATLATLGTGMAILMPGMGAENPLNSFSYLLPGIMIDQLYILAGERRDKALVILLVAGLSYASIPVSRLLVNLASGYVYMAFVKYGVLYTTLSFFFFGLAGGGLAIGLNKLKTLFQNQ